MRTELDDVKSVLRVMTAVRGLTELEVAALLRAVELLDQQDATIAALLAGTTNCARNLRNLGEAHRDGDDPIIDGIILDSGVIPEASMSSLFIAAADALDALAGVVEGEQ